MASSIGEFRQCNPTRPKLFYLYISMRLLGGDVFAKRRPAPPAAQKSGVQATQDQTENSIENEFGNEWSVRIKE